MADGSVDNLNIQVTADANRAVKSLNNLVSTLNKVNKAFSGMNTRSVSAFSSNVNKLATSMRALNGIKISTPNISGLTKQLNNLGKVDFSKISSAGKPIRELSSALNSLSGLSSVSIPKLETKNINSIINAVDKLGKIDSESLPKVADGLNKSATSLQTLANLKFNDSGLNKTINSLNRLFQADFGKFNPADFEKITSSISTLGNMPDVSSAVNRFVSSLSRLANAGEKTGQSASSVLRLGQETKKAAKELSSVGSINDDINLFVQSIGRLASAGNKTSQTASGLSTLAKETLEFFKAMQNAPRISENTIRMTQALAQLASAGGKVGTATGTITNAFQKLSNVGSKTLGVIKRVGSGIASAFAQIGSSGSGISRVQLGLGNLLKTVVGFQIGQGLLSFGKSMFTLGSDITEVENVVDVAFGSMSDKAYEFAETATEQFGLSELAAKQYSGTMMAMLTSSGVAQDAAAEMSTTLAGLAGDLASFYNLDTDEAFYKLRSAISGEVEPLRQLGINMTVANMEAYALSQGITESWQSMTQAEQAMLRYNYIMSTTSQQQGDFARTSGTWANQVRLLQLNIQSLASTLGQGLISAVLPAIKALNTLFAVLQSVANAVRNFFYVLTGYKPSSGGGGGLADAADDIGDSSAQLQSVGDSGTDAAKGMDKASKSAKKLKNNMNTLGIDELNIISPDTKSDTGGSGGSGGGAGGGAGAGGLGDMDTIFDSLAKSDVETPVNEWATRLRNAFLAHDWDKLGEEIAWGINKGLQFLYDAISWENVGPKITPFINAFTQTFNSLVDNIDWDLMGRTIGAGVNTIVNSLNLLIEGIDFKNLGTKISEGIRGAISEIQWTSLGNLLGNYFMISWDILSGVVSGLAQTGMAGLTGFEELGTAIGSAFNGIFQKIDFGEIGTTILTGLNGVFDAIRAFTITVDWDGLAENISNGLNNMIHGVNWSKNGATLSRFVRDMLGTIKDVAKEVDWEGLGKGIGDFLAEIDWVGILTDVGTIIYEAASGMISGLFDSDSGTVFKLITTFFVASKLVGIGTKFGNAISEAMTGKTITSNLLSKIGGWFSTSIIPKILPAASSIVTSVGTWITGTFAPAVASAFSAVAGVLFSPVGLIVVGAIIGGFLIWKNWDKITEFAGNVKDKVIDAFNNAKEWLKEKGQNLVQGLRDGWESVKNSEFLDKVSKIKDEAFEKVGNIKDRIKEKGKNVVQGLRDGYTSIKESQFLSTVAKIKDETFTKIGTMKEKITQKGKDVIQGLRNGYDSIKENGFLNTVAKIKDETFDRIGTMKEKITGKGKDIIHGLKEGLDDKWPGFSQTLSKLPDKVQKAIGSLKDVGKNLIQGFIDGMKSISIPLPKIEIGTTKKTILGKEITLPDFNIKWNAKGGLFDDPSIIGVGEAGKEAVIPLENPKTMRTIAKSILDNAPAQGFGLSANEMIDAVASGVLKGMANAMSNLSLKSYSFANLNSMRLVGNYRSYTPAFATAQSYSVGNNAGQYMEQQSVQTNYLLQQILDVQQQILNKDLSVNLDGKRTDTLLKRARNNSGYNFTGQ